MPLPFLKMHGLGNDFVIIDSRKTNYIPDPETCRKIADRHRGVGYDQLIVLLKPKSPEAPDSPEVFMQIFNPDGSDAGTCGNATRCVARLIFEETKKESAVIETGPGLLNVKKETGGLIGVDFGPPRLAWNEIPLARECDTISVDINHPPLAGGSKSRGLDPWDFGEGSHLPAPCCVSMGNPHAVFFVPDATAVPLAEIGPKIENHVMFPKRTNVEFAHIVDRKNIRMRVWERGTGITQACGSGACATLVAAVRRDLTNRRAKIILDGGELTIEWRENDGHVLMTGPATLSFKGELAEI